MLECWRLDPDSRISSQDLLERIQAEFRRQLGQQKELQWPAMTGHSTHRSVSLTQQVLDLDSIEFSERLVQLEIQPSQLTMKRNLGEGEFGSVQLAELSLSTAPKNRTNLRTINVAVKTLKSETTAEMRAKFLLEAKTLVALQHTNIVSVLAVCFTASPNLIVLELMTNGELREYLIHNRETLISGSLQLLHGVLVQIADAMTLLQKHRIVHRDLAARFVS
jgi:hypothetical protein